MILPVQFVLPALLTAAAAAQPAAAKMTHPKPLAARGIQCFADSASAVQKGREWGIAQNVSRAAPARVNIIRTAMARRLQAFPLYLAAR